MTRQRLEKPQTKTCEECKGTGYWCNYPPKPGTVLEMGDCCGVCCGKGFIGPEDVTYDRTT